MFVFILQVSAAMEMMQRLKTDLEGKETELSERQQSVSVRLSVCLCEAAALPFELLTLS